MASIQNSKKQLWRISSCKIRNGSAGSAMIPKRAPVHKLKNDPPLNLDADNSAHVHRYHDRHPFHTYHQNFSTSALTTSTKSSHAHERAHGLTTTIMDQSDPKNDEDNQHGSTTAQNEERDEQRKVAKNTVDLLNLAWADYRSTWEGFLDNTKLKKEAERHEKDTDSAQSRQSIIDIGIDIDIDTEALEEKGKELKANADRNVNMIKEEASTILGMAKEKTGLRTKKDVKAWAMEQLKLANECVAQFMKGYRGGRDEEMDKMMNEYFKDIDFDNDDDDNDDDGKNSDSDSAEDQRNVGRRRRRRRPPSPMT